jgi:iron complex outermembrane receptor protein
MDPLSGSAPARALCSDTLGWGPVSVLLGLRYTDYEEVNFNPNSSTSSYFHYHPVSPVYSISVAVLPTVRVYATYVEALQRGALAPAKAPPMPMLPSARSRPRNTKRGQGRRALRAVPIAFFRIATPSEYTDTTNTFVRNGTARYQGSNSTRRCIRSATCS